LKTCPEQFVDLVASLSWLGVLAAASRAAALAAVRELVAALGELDLVYRTEFECAQLSR